MTLTRGFIVILSTFIIAGCATSDVPSAKPHHKAAHNEPTPYNPLADAQADIDTAMQQSMTTGKMTIIAMGANWCHDSRALAAQFEKPRFQTLLQDHFSLVYVDVGKKDRNINIAQKFGVESIVGTPTVFIIGANGKVLNLETAPTWRNAASRTENDIFTYFANFSEKTSSQNDTNTDR